MSPKICLPYSAFRQLISPTRRQTLFLPTQQSNNAQSLVPSLFQIGNETRPSAFNPARTTLFTHLTQSALCQEGRHCVRIPRLGDAHHHVCHAVGSARGYGDGVSEQHRAGIQSQCQLIATGFGEGKSINMTAPTPKPAAPSSMMTV